MVPTVSPWRRRGPVAAVLLAGLLLFGAACGGGGSSSSDSSGDGSSATTVARSDSGSGSGSMSRECIELGRKFEEAADKIDVMGTDPNADVDAAYKALDQLTSSVPSEIRGDWRTMVDWFKELANVMKGIDTNSNDPAAMARALESMASMDTSKVESAMNNIDAYFNKTCPGMN